MSDAGIALNRFGLGARPDDAAPADPRRSVLDQFARFDPRPAAIAGTASSATIASQLAAYLAQVRRIRQRQGPSTLAGAAPPAAAIGMPPPAAAPGGQQSRDLLQQARQFAARQAQGNYAAAVAARADAALTTPAPFVERMVHFWANHFAVSVDKLQVIGLAGAFEFEAIRPHVLGRFRDMLSAVERHSAMLLYLDQAQSIGPDSPFAARANRRQGLNENLAREIMELHTLGLGTGRVRSLHSQADVIEFARALTGWTVAGLAEGRIARFAGVEGGAGRFVFAAPLHQPGDRAVLGKRYPAAGEAQAQAVLDDLAVHPATAEHLATKLARHFAGDTPPAAMVARLQAAFLTSGGDLPMVYRAIVASPEAWAPRPAKFRTPWEWTLAGLRALGYRAVPAGPTVSLLQQLGQPTWKPGSPAGYDDIAASWAGPDAVLRRVEAAERLASRAPLIDARQLAPRLFPGALAPATAEAIAHADSPGQALALLLVSPDMMRR